MNVFCGSWIQWKAGAVGNTMVNIQVILVENNLHMGLSMGSYLQKVTAGIGITHLKDRHSTSFAAIGYFGNVVDVDLEDLVAGMSAVGCYNSGQSEFVVADAFST